MGWSAVKVDQNRIVSTRDAYGNDLFDPNDIANEFVNYFQSIFTSTSTNNVTYILNMNIQNHADDFTNSVPDKQELFGILKEMRRNASPGPDGFNVGFYISAWDWTGDDVTKVVKKFLRIRYPPTTSQRYPNCSYPKKTRLPSSL